MAKIPASYFLLCDFQAIVFMSIFMGLTVYTTSAVANLVLDNPDIEEEYIPGQYLHVYSFLGFGIVVNIVAIFGIAKESPRFVLIIAILELLLLVSYILLALASLLDYPKYKPVCIHLRCADMFWLRNSGWRDEGDVCDKEDRKLPDYLRPDPYSLLLKYNSSMNSGNLNKNKSHLEGIINFERIDIGGEKGSKIASFIFMVLWCGFMVHTITVLIFYWIELRFGRVDGHRKSSRAHSLQPAKYRRNK